MPRGKQKFTPALLKEHAGAVTQMLREPPRGLTGSDRAKRLRATRTSIEESLGAMRAKKLAAKERRLGNRKF